MRSLISKRILTLIFLVTIFSLVNVNGQTPEFFKVKNPTRNIQFVDLSTSENSSFHKNDSRWLNELTESIESKRSKPLLYDFDNNTYQELSIQEFNKRRLLTLSPKSEWDIASLLSGYDFNIIGFDITSGSHKKKTIEQVNFLHFYRPLEFSMDSSLEYVFSLKWNDFLKFTKSLDDYKFVESLNQNVWKNDALYTYNDYYLDNNFLNDIYRKVNSNELSLFDLNDQKILPQNSGIPKNLDQVIVNDILHINFQQANNHVKIDTVFIDEYQNKWPSDSAYITEKKFYFLWSDYVSTSNNQSNTTPQITSYYNAFIHKLMTFNDSFEPVRLSKKGKYLKGVQDPFCQNTLKQSFEPSINFEQNSIYQYLLDESYTFLVEDNSWIGTCDTCFVGLLIEYLKAGKIIGYQSYVPEQDLLDEHKMSPKDILFTLNYQYDFPMYSEFFGNNNYDVGDTVCFGDTFKVLIEKTTSESSGDWGTIEPTDSWSSIGTSETVKSTKDTWTQIEPPQKKNISDLHLIEIRYKCSFNSKGQLLKMEPYSILLKVPGNKTKKGIEIPLITVKWSDCKSILDNDSRAFVLHKNKLKPLSSIIDDHLLYGYYLKTGYIQSVK